MSHEIQALSTVKDATNYALEAVRESVQRWALRREITRSIRQADSSLSDIVVRRVARYTASEIVAMSRENPGERIKRLQEAHTDSITMSRQTASFEGDSGITTELVRTEWDAITNLAQMYSGVPIVLSADGATLPLLRRASLIEMNNPGN